MTTLNFQFYATFTMPTPKYTHLFFDLDNTLWDFESNSYHALYSALDKLDLLKLTGSYDLYYAIYSQENDRLWDLYRQKLMPKKTLCAERFEASFEKNGTPLTIGGGVVNDAYLAEMVKQTKLVDGARNVLDYLHGRYHMALITNGFKEVQYEKIRKSELSKYFSKVFVSEEIGTPKPGREIFEHAVKSMNARKKNSIMIGDSWEADIVGAMNFGMDQIYYNPGKDKSAVEGMVFSASNPEFSVFIENTPSATPHIAKQNHKFGSNTTFISHLEQLLIIL